MFRRLKTAPRSTHIGWALVGALAVLALVPWAHAVHTVLTLLVAISALVFVTWATLADRGTKSLRVPIAAVGEEDEARVQTALETALETIATDVRIRRQDDGLTANFDTELSLATLDRRLKRALKASPLRHLKTRATLTYSALAPNAAAVVSVSGTVPPGATVHFDGCEATVTADSDGTFTAEVPLALVQHTRSGARITARYQRGEESGPVEVSL